MVDIEIGSEVIMVGNVMSTTIRDHDEPERIYRRVEVELDNGDTVLFNSEDLDTLSEGRFYTTVDSFLTYRKKLIEEEIEEDKKSISDKEAELQMLRGLTEDRP
jgi:hypothetical protein